jgi:hypothetical protein
MNDTYWQRVHNFQLFLEEGDLARAEELRELLPLDQCHSNYLLSILEARQGNHSEAVRYAMRALDTCTDENLRTTYINQLFELPYSDSLFRFVQEYLSPSTYRRSFLKWNGPKIPPTAIRYEDEILNKILSSRRKFQSSHAMDLAGWQHILEFNESSDDSYNTERQLTDLIGILGKSCPRVRKIIQFQRFLS